MRRGSFASTPLFYANFSFNRSSVSRTTGEKTRCLRQTTKSETQTSGESGLKVLVVERNGFAAQHVAWKADTLEELADMIGVDAQTLTDTVSAYNEAAGGAAGNNFSKSGFRSGLRPGGSRFLFIADYTSLSDGQAFRSSPAISPRISR